jgi:hypothetical protein
MFLSWRPTAQHSLHVPQHVHTWCMLQTAAATACLVSVEERAVSPVGEKVVLLL